MWLLQHYTAEHHKATWLQAVTCCRTEAVIVATLRYAIFNPLSMQLLPSLFWWFCHFTEVGFLDLKELLNKHLSEWVLCMHTGLKGLYAGWDKSYLIPLLLVLKLYRCGSTADNRQYSLCLSRGKSAQETKKSGSKHLSVALCGVHEQNVLHAEHAAIVYFTKLATKQKQQNRNETLGNGKHAFKC